MLRGDKVPSQSATQEHLTLAERNGHGIDETHSSIVYAPHGGEFDPAELKVSVPENTRPGSDADRSRLVSQLKTEVLTHISSLGLTLNSKNDPLATLEKESIRASHSSQRLDLIQREWKFMDQRLDSLLEHFADGSEIQPEKIEPELLVVEAGKETGMLFRLATLLWSVPVSRGYGRRMRFLVRDRQNGKLIGLFALGDPVFNLRDRDKWIGWNANDRRQRLVNLMDAYVVGSVPPYSQLLGGKLVASLIGSSEVSNLFAQKYSQSEGLISGQVKSPKLVLVTVTSALGRSSIYNRLRLPDVVELLPIGRTQGWGHFQVSEVLFEKMRLLLTMDEHRYASGHSFGAGPNWRMRVIREALKRLDLDENLLRHGIAREIFAMPLADGWRPFLCGDAADCHVDRPAVQEIAAACKERWILPRAHRRPEFSDWTRGKTFELLDPAGHWGR